MKGGGVKPPEDSEDGKEGGDKEPGAGTGDAGNPDDGNGGTGDTESPDNGDGGTETPGDGTGDAENPDNGDGGTKEPGSETGDNGNPDNGDGGTETPDGGNGDSGSPDNGNGSSETPGGGNGDAGNPDDGDGGGNEDSGNTDDGNSSTETSDDNNVVEPETHSDSAPEEDGGTEKTEETARVQDDALHVQSGVFVMPAYLSEPAEPATPPDLGEKRRAHCDKRRHMAVRARLCRQCGRDIHFYRCPSRRLCAGGGDKPASDHGDGAGRRSRGAGTARADRGAAGGGSVPRGRAGCGGGRRVRGVDGRALRVCGGSPCDMGGV